MELHGNDQTVSVPITLSELGRRDARSTHMCQCSEKSNPENYLLFFSETAGNFSVKF